ncbi:MAG: hypothetical protein M3Y24_05085 [Acidobacteriota bacterium]|nr:hypothetical protein [Acidobacteriota bacterium]
MSDVLPGTKRSGQLSYLSSTFPTRVVGSLTTSASMFPDYRFERPRARLCRYKPASVRYF